MAANAICPSCGYDIAKDEPIERAGMSMKPYGEVCFNGAEVRLTPNERGVLWALLKSDRPLPRHVLAERIGYDGDHNPVDVYLTRIRHKLAPHGEVPIRNRLGVGVYIDA